MTTDRRLLQGIAVGLAAASIGALYTVFARWGIAQGMQATDMTFLRFAIASVLTLPVLVRVVWVDADSFIAQWRVWLAVSLLAGPLFGILMFTALQSAPASHAAVFPFTAMSVMGTLYTYSKLVSLLWALHVPPCSLRWHPAWQPCWRGRCSTMCRLAPNGWACWCRLPG